MLKIRFSHRVDLSRIICIAIFFCFFDAVLRVDQKNGLTFDRFFLVVPVFAVLFYETRAYLKMISIFTVFATYNAVLSAAFGSFDYYLEMSFHYFVISHLLFFVAYLLTGPTRGRAMLLCTLKLGCYTMVAVTLIQFVLHFHLPNVDVYENGEYSSFFRLANDQSLALAGAVPIFFLLWREKQLSLMTLSAVLVSIFVICLHNHTKTALGAVILYCVLLFVATFRIRISIGLIAIVVVVFVFKDATLHISYQEYTIDDLIITPIRNLVLFQSYEEIGSIETRVNASIIGLKALYNSHMLGIGYGNSVALLAMPENQLELAKSLHNDTLAFLLEEGLVAAVIYIYGVRRAIAMSRGKRNYLSNIKLCCYYAFPIAILSSSGVTSNYFFLTCLFALILVRPIAGRERRPRTSRSAVVEVDRNASHVASMS